MICHPTQRADPAVIVASYERDLGNTECLFPVVPRNHPINSTGTRYIDAPRNTTQPEEPQVTEQPIRTT
jgi:hypothetical protein